MPVTLLDVNVLVALFWRPHPHHAIAQGWFKENERLGWATCPITQAAFARIISNPAFSESAPRSAQALALLQENLRSKHHRFLADDLSVPEALEQFGPRITGHLQITDAYLLALAMHHKVPLATFDRGLVNLLPEDQRQSGCIVQLSA
jgi:hypothetical protein